MTSLSVNGGDATHCPADIARGRRMSRPTGRPRVAVAMVSRARARCLRSVRGAGACGRHAVNRGCPGHRPGALGQPPDHLRGDPAAWRASASRRGRWPSGSRSGRPTSPSRTTSYPRAGGLPPHVDLSRGGRRRDRRGGRTRARTEADAPRDLQLEGLYVLDAHHGTGRRPGAPRCGDRRPARLPLGARRQPPGARVLPAQSVRARSRGEVRRALEGHRGALRALTSTGAEARALRQAAPEGAGRGGRQLGNTGSASWCGMRSRAPS